MFPHWFISLARGELGLYEGCASTSLERMGRDWKLGSLLRNIQHARCEMLFLRGRLCVHEARARQDLTLLRQARSDAKALAREGRPWSIALATLLRASVASFDNPTRATSLLIDAERRLTSVEMRVHAAAARYGRGKLVLADQGDSLLAEAEAEILACGAQRPDSVARMLIPGLW